ncbi:MAG: hypothetical protein AABX49_02240 [Nanoarchaeota archaeon]
MLKLLGVLDLITAVFFILAQWDVGLGVAEVLAFYILIKSILFFGDWASFIDLLSGAYLLLLVYDIHSAFSLVFILWLLQKSFFSIFF